MPIRPNDFFDSAIRLSAEHLEIDHRNSASRAYYAAYHAAKEISHHCPSNDHLSIAGGVHSRLIDRFERFDRSNPVSTVALSIAYMLRQMKTVRQFADYELHEIFTSDDALSQIAYAEKIIAKLNTFTQKISNVA